MNKGETAQIIAVIKEYYPLDKEATNITNKVNAWYVILKDYDYNLIQNALIAYVTQSNSQFPPSVASLVAKANELMNYNKYSMTELEAWNCVVKAVRNSWYNSEKEFEKLPPAVKKVIGSPNTLKEWGQMKIEDFNTVIQSNFMRSYTAKIKQEKDHNVLPSSVKNYIENVSKQFKELQ